MPATNTPISARRKARTRRAIVAQRKIRQPSPGRIVRLGAFVVTAFAIVAPVPRKDGAP
jgi:hypothetical protein